MDGRLKKEGPVSPFDHQNALQRIGQARDHLVTGELFTIWHCEESGLRITWPWPDAGAIGKYYDSKEYISHTNSSIGMMNRLYKAARFFTVKSKRNVINRRMPERGRLLDIGCGTGEFLYTMKKSGWEVTGVEPNIETRKMANWNYGLEVHPVEDLFDFPESHFNVITLWHVLEHVEDLNRYMKQLHSMLRPGGLLVIALPNYQSYDARFYGMDWAGWDVPRHHYHFNPDSLKRTLQRHGFTLEGMKRMHLDAAYVCMLTEKYRGEQGRMARGLGVAALSWARALINKENSSSITYLARPEKT